MKILALGADDPDPIVVVIVEFRQRIRQLLHHGRRERVLLGGVVDDDLEYAIMRFGSDFALGGHGLVSSVDTRKFLCGPQEAAIYRI